MAETSTGEPANVGKAHHEKKPRNNLESPNVRKGHLVIGLAQIKAMAGMTVISEEDDTVKQHLIALDILEREIAMVVNSLKQANAQRRALEVHKTNLIHHLMNMESPGHFTVLSHRMADYLATLEKANQIYATSLVNNWEKPLTALLNNEMQLSKKVRSQYQYSKLIYDDCLTAVKNIETKIKELEDEANGVQPETGEAEHDKVQKAKAMFSKWMKKKQTPEELQVKLEEAKAKVADAERDYKQKKDELVQVIQIIQEKRNTELAVEFEKFQGCVHESTEEIVKLRYQTNPDPSAPAKAPIAPTAPMSPKSDDDEEP